MAALIFSPSLLPFFPPSSSIPSNGFTISLAGPQGQIVGGSVAGSLIAAGTVIVVAAAFVNPSYYRLPDEDEEPNSVSAGTAGKSPTTVTAAGGEGHHTPAESTGYKIPNLENLYSKLDCIEFDEDPSGFNDLPVFWGRIANPRP
ncbi:hypothetical protein HHK36_031949 [Tetracentron sinense]|uniref:PPC domain-containing protein n=1 Tax=Tetracentron sinense TaxID=13715 RepID=A0A834YBK5_TETSI|nr:hypothetical protein HHK36_031949 [Tetracentron sinense]